MIEKQRPTLRVVIGVGNLDRGDDAVGRIVARRLARTAPGGTTVIERDGGATELMAAWDGVDVAVVIDATSCGAEPGTVRRLEAHGSPLPTRLFSGSTHGFGVAEAVELSRALGTLPATVIVYGVEAAGFEPGAPLSPPVESAVDIVFASVLSEIAGLGGR